MSQTQSKGISEVPFYKTKIAYIRAVLKESINQVLLEYIYIFLMSITLILFMLKKSILNPLKTDLK